MVNDGSLAGEILTMVQHEIQQLPASAMCIITRKYDDGFADVNLNGTVLHYIKCIGNPLPNDEAVLCFLDNDFSSRVVICVNFEDYYTKQEVLDLITGDIDLKDYVKKPNVKLKFDLEDNGTIILGLDIGDGF